jgi:acetylornithine deacetylase/succinyl-diaminopimelate desuccinylase-like protein/predicted GIY-YIG superfamily endonuclease
MRSPEKPASPALEKGGREEMPETTAWVCYLLCCRDGTLYVGITNRLARRLSAHNAGTASRYTRARLPVRLARAEPCRTRSEAARREIQLKRLSRAEKLALIAASPTSGSSTTWLAFPSAAGGSGAEGGTMNGPGDSALRYLEEHFDEFKKTLVDLSRIPSISADGFPREEVRRSAGATAETLRAAGIQNVQVLEIPGVHAYVYGDWLRRPGAPTILLYGHHDVQPPGRPEKWLSPPFEPTERNGRLYGRGTADDKGGVMVHVAAVASYLKSAGSLPCNVKFIVEGEEEIGSGHLGKFLAKYRRMMAADFIVLSDTSNFDTGVPALTYQLRGICQVDVEVQGLKQPVHSGRGGGPVPDPVQILCRLIADLEAPDGSLAIPGLYRKVARPGTAQLARIRKLPFSEAKFKREMGMLPGVGLAGERRYSVYERLWTRPALTVIAFEARPFLGSSNQIIDSARARLSMRTVPGMDAREAGRRLIRKLTAKPPHGVRVTAQMTASAPWWTTDPEGPAFEAARRALRAGFGREATMIGAGGTIGFVQPFADLLGGAPCLLTGVEDPKCNAHSENESLHLGDWARCMRSAVHLYDELSRVPVARRR